MDQGATKTRAQRLRNWGDLRPDTAATCRVQTPALEPRPLRAGCQARERIVWGCLRTGNGPAARKGPGGRDRRAQRIGMYSHSNTRAYLDGTSQEGRSVTPPPTHGVRDPDRSVAQRALAGGPGGPRVARPYGRRVGPHHARTGSGGATGSVSRQWQCEASVSGTHCAVYCKGFLSDLARVCCYEESARDWWGAVLHQIAS